MNTRPNLVQLLARQAGRAGLLLLAAGVVVILLRPTDAAWWAARVLGLAALLTMAAALALRPTPDRPRRHNLLGWAALAALLGHIGVVAGLQPVFWRWLTWAVPVEIVTGFLAVAAFAAALAAQRPGRLRDRLGPILGHRVHRFAGYVLAAAAAAHIALVAGISVVAVVVILAGLAFLVVEGIFRERHGVALAATLALLTTAVAALSIAPLAGPRLEALRRSPVDHANFLHSDHPGLACAGCHHNFTDQTGNENCLTCHKRISTIEAMRIDRMFHAFCGECHRADKHAGKEFGPIDDCNGCHAKQAEGEKDARRAAQ
ncbi:cytochrome c3 family protein [Mesorhizobium sp. LHD-90]|uniref:cytochrome c3 family protein n=1 Tax=Mesorhizobium sp. LHD-90 TaxID=3071414 RepID=UPI0027E15114|nr:cytochrome c3 family protein [Mesorhizobium sp. LHD-90]MDQ6434418.1 cytochrome c3 family protein [Mesorhizobium sp. LHD-90]